MITATGSNQYHPIPLTAVYDIRAVPTGAVYANETLLEGFNFRLSSR